MWREWWLGDVAGGLRTWSVDLDLAGVVRLTDGAFKAKPVIWSHSLCGAVITVDQSGSVGVLRRHRLRSNAPIQIPELHLHIHHTLAAQRALVRSFHVIVVALVMDAVSAPHEDDRPCRRKHVAAADRAVAIR